MWVDGMCVCVGEWMDIWEKIVWMDGLVEL